MILSQISDELQKLNNLIWKSNVLPNLMSVAYVSSKNVNDIRNKGIKYILFSISVTQNVVAGIGQHNGVHETSNASSGSLHRSSLSCIYF